ncbi:MAG: MFS transporter [Desulfobacterales bacterium]|nr:MFS transporter [Desulfobacterales bacterium]
MITSQTKKAMRMAILTQCTGMIPTVLFNNGFLLTYMSKLGISSANILILLTLPTLIIFLSTMPFAFLSDRFGKKKLGMIGMIEIVIGFLLLMFAGIFQNESARWTVVTGITVYGIGAATMLSSWFALLEPIVPLEIRGRFFGKLRLSWHIVGIVLSIIVSVVLEKYSTLIMYQVILAFIVILLVVRIFFYVQIPEIEKPMPRNIGIRKALIDIIRIPGYFPFCSYVFLISLFTGACPWIFGLLEKDVLFFNESQIIMMGYILIGGSLAGYYFGGRIIDTYGTKLTFLICHLFFGTILFLFVGRAIFPWPVIVTVGFLTGCHGMLNATLVIAVVTEMMLLIPKENKSLSTSFNNTLLAAGVALSGIISGKVIELGILNKSWELFGQAMSDFDTLLLGCGIMVIMLIVTLGLIPSVVGKAQWIPRAS